MTAIATKRSVWGVGTRLLTYAGPGAIRFAGGMAFYLVLAIASVLRGVEFAATITVLYTLFTFISNTGFNWFEQSYLRYQDLSIGRNAARVAIFLGVIALVSALYSFRSFNLSFALTLALLFAVATIFESMFRFTIADLIVRRQERRYSQIVVYRAVLECSCCIAVIFLARSDRQAILGIFFALIVARFIAADTTHLLPYRGHDIPIPRVPFQWFVYGGSLTMLLAIYQGVVIYIQHQADLSSATESALVVGQKYIQQMGQVMSGIMLVSLAPRVFAVEPAMQSRALSRFTIIYSALVISANFLLTVGAFVAVRRIVPALTTDEVLIFFVSSTSFSLAVMSHKSFELTEKTHLCVILMAISALTTLVLARYIQRVNHTGALVIGFAITGPLYYFGSASLDLFRVRISSIHAIFHIVLSSILLATACIIIVWRH